jgi:phosphoribosylformimino-5-aminoimidazole carboxamide ribotide isomerase
VSGPTLYPAIDILGGKTVRLTRGEYERSKVYEDDPLAAARRWVEEGAEALHVVDLDGARAGRPMSLEHLRRISEFPVPIQYGGGLRSLESVVAALQGGADRVVLGTAAFSDSKLLENALERFGEQIAVSVDVREGRVATSGWIERIEMSGPEAVRALRRQGVCRFVYTNIDRDGTLSGIDPKDVELAAEAVGDGQFVYSGGISSLGDLVDVGVAHHGNLEGVIVGKALYEKNFRLQDGKRALEAPEEAAEWS